MTTEWIISNPEILGGKPCVRSTRISVEFVLEQLASGGSNEDVLRAYPHITLAATEGRSINRQLRRALANSRGAAGYGRPHLYGSPRPGPGRQVHMESA